MTLLVSLPARRRAVARAALALGLALQIQAAAAQPVPFDIPPDQPLAAALERLAEQAGLQLVFAPELAEGRQAPALQGSHEVADALRLLLAGSGLQGQVRGRTLVVERPAQAGDQATLPAVTVKAQADSDGTTEHSGSYTTGSSNAATGLGLSLRETPQSVSVITRQRMDDQGLVQLSDVIQQTPGLTFSRGGSGASVDTDVYSRGFSVDTFQIDGVSRITDTASSLFSVSDVFLYDRVEVVRGATGLMNGVGTPGASINAVRKRPTSAFQGALNLSVGRWDSYRGELDLSSKLTESGGLRGRLLAAWQDNASQLAWGKENRKTVAAFLEADLAPGTLLNFGATLQQYHSDGANRTGRPLFDANGARVHWALSDSAGARWASADRDDYTVFARLEHALGNEWQLRATLEFDRSTADNWIGYANRGNPDPLTGAGVGLWAARWKYQPDQTTLDLSARGPFQLWGRRHDAALGVTSARTWDEHPTYRWWSFDDWDPWIGNIYTWDGHTPGRPDNPSTGTESSDERRTSAFASVRLRATDSLSAILGTRVTNWQEESCNRPTGEAADCDKREETGELTPYLALVYDIDRHWSVYGSYTNIFKPQSYKEPGGRFLDPLLGDSYELGGKGALLDGRLNLAAAVYLVKQDNLAVAIPNVFVEGTDQQAYRPVSGTRTEGFELEANGALSDRWQLGAGYSRNLVRDRDGAALNTQVPTTAAKLFSSYRLGEGLKGLTVGGGLRWQNRSWSDFGWLEGSPRVTQGAYAIVDLSARYAFSERVAVLVNAYNLFDKRYQAVSSSSYYGEARNLRATLQLRF